MDRSRGHKIPTMFTALLKEHAFLYSSVKSVLAVCSLRGEWFIVPCGSFPTQPVTLQMEWIQCATQFNLVFVYLCYCHSADGVNTVCHPVQSWVCVFVLLSLCRWSVMYRPVECCLQQCSMLERSGLLHIREVHSNTAQCAIVLLHCIIALWLSRI